MAKLLRKLYFPGFRRWLLYTCLGFLVIIFGLALILKARPVTIIYNLLWDILSFIADRIPPTTSGIIAISLGAVLLLYALFRANKQIFSLIAPDESSMLEALDRYQMQGRGLKVLAIGGGTGLSNMLRGLKEYSSNITAVVTVADDGGSSGKLRESMNIVPPGDMRNCIAALAHDEEVITKLFQYRFDNEAPDSLRNHSFGNLFLTALVELGGTGNMADAVRQACNILKTRGIVLPVSNIPMSLIAKMADDSLVRGESNIPKADGKIKKIFCEEPLPPVLPQVIEAIKLAELIILGPGSLYTSVIPNLLVPDLLQAIDESKAPKVYICNVMTQPGETNNYSVSDHVKAILDHTEQGQKIIDYVVVNNAEPDKNQLAKYKADGQYPVEVDLFELKKLGVKVISANLLNKGNLVRHNPKKLAKTIMKHLGVVEV